MAKNLSVKIKQLHENAIIPKYQTTGSAGMDLHSVEDMELWVGETKAIPTGIAISVPDGHEAQIRPRSGLAVNRQITVLNSPGTIDSDYTGEIKVILINHSDEIFRIKRGDRIAQIVFAPVSRARFEVVSELESTGRGAGGFGSTGN
jgi:dUTP pyrophosphatase